MNTEKAAAVQVTGYQLQRAIHNWEKIRDLAVSEFPDSISKFPEETKAHPDEVMARIVRAEHAVASLQAAQARYNLGIFVDLAGSQVSLTEAVKRVGGAARVEKLWNNTLKSGDNGYRSDEREADKIYKQALVTLQGLQQRTLAATRNAADLRQAIAVANGTKLEISLDPVLLFEEV